jgi:hypothetical protein
MTAAEELKRAQLAKEVLDNEVYKESMAQLQTEILAKWQNEVDQGQREWLWSMIRASKRLEKVLEQTMVTGQLRAKQIEMEQGRLAKIGKALRAA